MKGIILAGGTGSRLRPITHTGPKQLIPIGNKPIIDYVVEDLREAGITDIGVVLGKLGREKIQSHLGDGSDFNVNITYIVQGEPLGLAHAIGCTRDFVGDEPFLVYLGDNVMNERITDLVNEFDSSSYSAGIGIQEVDEPSRYGIVELDDQGTIVRLLEKPDDPPSNLALIGVYIFTDAIFDQIERLEPSWRNELEITEAIQGLLEDGYTIQSHRVEGWWKDTGKPTDILHANRLVLDKMNSEIEGSVEDGASLRGRIQLGEESIVKSGATIRGPVSIGDRTTIGSDTYIGPYTSIGDDCDIKNVHIEASIVIGESQIDCDRVLVDSLVGRKTSIVSKDGTKPDGNQLVVGENSSLKI